VDEVTSEVIALEGFSEILAAYYQEQKIGRLWRELVSLCTTVTSSGYRFGIANRICGHELPGES